MTLLRSSGTRAPGRGRIARSVALTAVLLATATACITPDRPTFGCSAAAPTGRLEVDNVLDRLDCVVPTAFTAEYSVLTRLGNIQSTATVVQSAAGRRSITINNVRYLYDGGRRATCDVVAQTCEAIINEARTSDVALTSQFYDASMSARLQVDADRRIGDPIASEQMFGDQTALCVDIPVTGGTKVYCALPAGPIARFDANDLLIELTSFSTTADEAAFDS